MAHKTYLWDTFCCRNARWQLLPLTKSLCSTNTPFPVWGLSLTPSVTKCSGAAWEVVPEFSLPLCLHCHSLYSNTRQVTSRLWLEHQASSPAFTWYLPAPAFAQTLLCILAWLMEREEEEEVSSLLRQPYWGHNAHKAKLPTAATFCPPLLAPASWNVTQQNQIRVHINIQILGFSWKIWLAGRTGSAASHGSNWSGPSSDLCGGDSFAPFSLPQPASGTHVLPVPEGVCNPWATG